MVDAVIIGIIVFSLMVSLWRGFMREVLSLAGWVAAFFVASKFYPHLSVLLKEVEVTYLENDFVRNGVAAALLFIAVIIVSGIINALLSLLVDKTGLSGTDRVLGAAFGALRGIFIVAGLLFFLTQFTAFEQTELWRHSQLIPHFDFIVSWFFEQLKTNSHLLPSA